MEEKIYGERPSGEAWAKRMKKDKIDPSQVLAATERVFNVNTGSPYWKRVWAVYRRDHEEIVGTDYTNGKPITQKVKVYSVYHTLCNGNIGRSWVDISDRYLKFE